MPENEIIEMVHWSHNREHNFNLLGKYSPEERVASLEINRRLERIIKEGGSVYPVDGSVYDVMPLPGIKIKIGGASLDGGVDERLRAHLAIGNDAEIDYTLAIRLLPMIERRGFGYHNEHVWGPRKEQ